ncbi:hypothetical protein L4D08_23605, partial [Photobacterium chitinilyticum]|uniref:hypothetical protein n=1 Tax=Photobacterium chitinilyticum TaxID=2485123 RepID=UPI003D133E51
MLKPSILFILILCISGYQLLDKIHHQRYKLKRSSGYHTFFKSATVGILLFLATSVLFAITHKLSEIPYVGFELPIGFWFLESLFPDSDITRWEGTLCEIGIIMLVASRFSTKFLYADENKKVEYYMNSFQQDPESPEFTRLFFMSLEYGLPILFTMSDRKVYIGYLMEVHA